MHINTLKYAQKNLDINAKENKYKTFISQDNLYLEFATGHNVKLSEDEVLYQAKEYLNSEINLLNL